MFFFLMEVWSSFTELFSEVVPVLADPLLLLADLLACFTCEGLLVAKVVFRVSGPFGRFVTTSKVVFLDWVPAITATSFLSAEMVILQSLKDFEGHPLARDCLP